MSWVAKMGVIEEKAKTGPGDRQGKTVAVDTLVIQESKRKKNTWPLNQAKANKKGSAKKEESVG